MLPKLVYVLIWISADVAAAVAESVVGFWMTVNLMRSHKGGAGWQEKADEKTHEYICRERVCEILFLLYFNREILLKII